MNNAKNFLQSAGYNLTDSEIIGGVSYNAPVNAGTDFTLGSCVISTIEFQLKNFTSTLDDLTRKEFVWKQAIPAGEKSFAQFVKATRSKLVCIHGAVGYVVSDRAPYLSIWNVTDRVKDKDVVEPPQLPIKSLILSGSKLYCLHDISPYVTAYAASGANLTLTESASLNTFEIQKIIGYCQLGTSYNLQGTVLKEYVPALYDLKPIDLIEHAFDIVQRGVFIAEKPEKINETRVKIKCVDRLQKLEIVVDEWIDGLNYPLTLKAILSSLCAKCGVMLANTSFFNDDFIVQKNFKGDSTTGIEVLRWIAEVAASYGITDEQGRILLDWYKPTSYVVDSSQTMGVQLSEFITDKIERLQIRVTENAVDVIVPENITGKNSYIIEGNPLLFSETDAELRPTANKIFDRIKGYSIQPYKLKMQFANINIKRGDIISVTTKTGQMFSAWVMGLREQNGSQELEATGNQRRPVQSNMVNRQIRQLRGRSNELIFDLEQTKNTLTEYKTNTDKALSIMQTDIRATSEGLTTKVSKDIYDENNALIQNQFSQVSQTVNSWGVTIGEQGKEIASLKFSTEGLDLAIKNGSLIFDKDGMTVSGTGRILAKSTEGQVLISGSSVSFNNKDGVDIGYIGGRINSFGEKVISMSADVLSFRGVADSLETGFFVYNMNGRYPLRRRYVTEYKTYFATFGEDLDSPFSFRSPQGPYEELPPLSINS